MTRICPRCSSEIDPASNLCPACLFGEGLKDDTISCPKCHAGLDEGARFCSHCGAMASSGSEAGDPIRIALTEKLGSQYRIIRLLGRGGMGCVYLARDLTLDREVAIKVVRTEDQAGDLYDRFRREARTAARLSHPNIVALHAFGDVDGMPYFVMGYVRGESLADRLRREGRLPEDEVRRIVVEVADALDHAHRQGVVHRDVKPDNVLLDDETGRALLTDFGVARAFGKGETLTRSGSVVGTPHYMSPEQASGGAVDGRSDLYSLGVMAYGMIAGRLPFEGETPAEVLKKHLTQEPVPLGSLAPTVADSLAHAIDRCLAKDPSERWPDGRSLRLTLGSADESLLPEPLQGVDGGGIVGVMIVLISLAIIFLTGKATGADVDPDLQALLLGPILLLFMPLLLSGFYIFLIVKLRRQGIRTAQAHRALWREPSWWPTWYPRILRRPGNVWERLPRAIRYYRSWPLFLVCYAVLWVVVSEVFDLPVLLRDNPIAFSMCVGGLLAIVGAWFAMASRARAALENAGLQADDIPRIMITVPPSRTSFWIRPNVAAALSPSDESSSGPRAVSPHDQMQSILRYADELSGPLRPLGAEACAAARHLVASIDLIDREIADLARSVEPGEEERLTNKIDALASTDPADDANTPMRTLLERQLELIRDLSARIDEAQRRRTRRIELLRMLALHMASLHARARKAPDELREISDNVRALCDDARKHTAAFDAAADASAPTLRIPEE